MAKTKTCPKCKYPMHGDEVEWYCEFCDYSELVDVRLNWKDWED